MKQGLLFSLIMFSVLSTDPLTARPADPPPFLQPSAIAGRLGSQSPASPMAHTTKIYMKSVDDTVACPSEVTSSTPSANCFARGTRSYPPLPFVRCDPGDLVVQTAAFLEGGPYSYPTIFEQEGGGSSSSYAFIPAIVRGSNPPKIVLVWSESIMQTDLGEDSLANYIDTPVRRFVTCLDTDSLAE